MVYTLTLANLGDQPARGVVIAASAQGALRFAGNTTAATVNVGDIAPGITQTVIGGSIPGRASPGGRTTRTTASSR